MNQYTINALKELKNGESITITKDSPDEIFDIVQKLKNLEILHKINSTDYIINQEKRELITKLIELKSWDEFNEWLDRKSNLNSTSININNSNVRQVNQSPESLIVDNSNSDNYTINKSDNSSKESVLSKIGWKVLIPIIVGLIIFIITKYINI